MQNFEREFEEFCKSPNVDSGKARSYVKAICYLCDYIGIYEMNEDAVNKIKQVEASIKEKESPFYQDFLKFLSGRKQKSYLEKGFVSAALKYFSAYSK